MYTTDRPFTLLVMLVLFWLIGRILRHAHDRGLM